VYWNNYLEAKYWRSREAAQCPVPVTTASAKLPPFRIDEEYANSIIIHAVSDELHPLHAGLGLVQSSGKALTCRPTAQVHRKTLRRHVEVNARAKVRGMVKERSGLSPYWPTKGKGINDSDETSILKIACF
jgi:hypothetical protein